MLNKEQITAVRCINKPCIVIAGPGTGKTTVICEKILHLKKLGIDFNQILALSFSDKAANEMKLRVEEKSNEFFDSYTFHSFALSIIDEFLPSFKNLREGYSILDESYVKMFFLSNFSEFTFSSINVNDKQLEISNLLTHLNSRLKDFGYFMKDISKLDLDLNLKSDLLGVFSKYEKFKIKNNSLDFGDILLKVFQLLTKREKIRNYIKNKYKYILVDEFQDTNLIQLELLKIIANDNITIVGDLKQSIYSFRGANYANLKTFKEYFGNYEEIFLINNYRSSKNILNFVNQHIDSDKEKLKSNMEIKGNFNLTTCSNENSQLNFILNKINYFLELYGKETSIGILCRRKAEVNMISNYLRKFKLEFNSGNVENIFLSKQVCIVIDILQVILKPYEANSTLFKLLSNLGIRTETVLQISRKSSFNEKSIFKVLENFDSYKYDNEREIVNIFFKKLKTLIEKNGVCSIKSLVLEIMDIFHIYKKVLSNKNFSEISSLNGFLNFVGKFERIYNYNNLDFFLNFISVSKKIGYAFENDINMISKLEVLTIHQSKGKEFDNVILPFLNDRKFPIIFKKNIFQMPFDISKEEFFNEEKRLFFVAISRAKINLEMSYVKKFLPNKLDSKKSVLIENLESNSNYDEESIEVDFDIKDQIKSEFLNKISLFIFENRFDKAKLEIDNLSTLFGKTKDLNAFISKENKELLDYKNRIKEDKSFLENVKIDRSKMIYSVSQLQTYENCPKKYLYSYVYKIPSISKHYFDFGTSIHKVLELLVEEIDKNLPFEELYLRGCKLLEKHWISNAYKDSNQERIYYEKGLNILREFLKKEINLRKFSRKIVAQEKKFYINISGRKLMGIIDRIDKTIDGYEILDYKTSNSMEEESKLNQNMQLLIYAMALKKDPLFNDFPKKVGLWYLIHDKIKKISPNEENINLVIDRALKIIEKIEKEDFNSKPSFFACNFCDYSNICQDSKKQ